MTFARPIIALLAASAASAAAFAPAAPLSSAARPVQSATKASPTLLRAPRAMPAQRRASSGVNGMAMAWEDDGYLIAPSIVNADLVSPRTKTPSPLRKIQMLALALRARK